MQWQMLVGGGGAVAHIGEGGVVHMGEGQLHISGGGGSRAVAHICHHNLSMIELLSL